MRYIALLAGLLLSGFGQLYGQLAAHFSFNDTSGAATTVDSVSLQQFTIANHFGRPERIAGVAGAALRLDGWSTWIEAPGYQLPGIGSEMTIEAWHATESFTAAAGGIVSQIGGGTGFSLEVGSFGQVIFAFHADGQFYVLATAQQLEKYRWNHVVATVELPGQLARIYVNGAVWAEQTLGNHQSLTPANVPLYIGRQTNNIEVAGFTTSALNGALDELRVYTTALDAGTVAARYAEHADAVPDLSIDPGVRHASDHLRPRYHAMPNTSWTNEGYGLIRHNGRYHFFFQKNPNGPYLHFMHWGHLSSPDLVNWTEEKIALAPSSSPGFDNFGVWSGTTTTDPTGKPVVLYTGVNGVKAAIGLAVPADDSLIRWQKSAANPVIAGAPAVPLNLDFRDPFIWQEDGVYYMIIGSGVQFNGGGILFLYRSTDLVDWEELPHFFYHNNPAQSGYFWEMPFLVPLGDGDYLLGVNPTPQPDQRAETLYWFGTIANHKFVPHHAAPKKFELINENLLAPALGVDEAGRHVYLGILPEDRAVADQIAAGWRHTFSLPRIVRPLTDTTLGHTPHPHLCRLRGDHAAVLDRQIQPGTEFNLPELSGTQTELRFQLHASADAVFYIDVYKHADEQERTSIRFDLAQNTVTLDRLHSSLAATLEDIRQAAYVFSPADTLLVTIFLDHSTLEVFLDNLVVFSARVYPAREESRLVDLVVDNGSVTVDRADAWQLAASGESAGTGVCEPGELPPALFSATSAVEPAPVGRPGSLRVSPNPAAHGSAVTVEVGPAGPDGAQLDFYTPAGQPVKSVALYAQRSTVRIDDLPAGLYLLRLSSANQVATARVVIY
jgi:sucrose-6-phosphate hydrolase SacC (GH32 family)